jgi:hypothetical protein
MRCHFFASERVQKTHLTIIIQCNTTLSAYTNLTIIIINVTLQPYRLLQECEGSHVDERYVGDVRSAMSCDVISLCIFSFLLFFYCR